MNEEDQLTSILKELEQDPDFKTKTANKGTFTPTLVVGLGGTGTRVLRQLKKYLGAERANNVRLFGIDSDQSENGKFAMPALSDTELCLLKPDRAISALDRFAAGDPDYQWLSSLLQETGPENSIEAEIRKKVQAGHGCGQLRRAGRLMFFSDVAGGANIRNEFNKLHQELRSLQAELKHIHGGFTVTQGSRIFVVSSFAGGTGAGILIDTLALLRTVFDGANDDITVIGLLPGRALDRALTDAVNEKDFTRGNAIGVLRELDALCKPGYKRKFQFGARTTIDWDSTRQHIATNVYLVDNECGLRGGAPVTDWDELISATGFFLYNFLENGVGASAFSGEINYSPDKNYEGKNGAVYRSFGVGALRYPVEDITRLGLYSLATRYFSDAIKAPKGAVSQAKSELKSTLNNLKLNGHQSFNSFFKDIIIDEATFKQSSAQWKAIKWASDGDLISAGQTAIKTMMDGLASYDDRFNERITEEVTRMSAVVEQQALKMLTGNHVVAKKHFGLLLDTLEGWNTKLYDELTNLSKKIADAKLHIANLERKINKWDFFLDIKFRASYRVAIQSYLADIETENSTGKARYLIVSLMESVRGVQARSIAIFEELRGKRDAYRSYAERYGDLLSEGVFVQSGMNKEDVTKWLEKLSAKVEYAPAVDLSLAGVLRPLFLPLLKSMRSSLMSKDIVADAFKGRDKSLLNKLKGVNEAGQPLIALKSTAPHEEDLTPQKYILAVSAKSKQSELMEIFPGVGQNQTKMEKLESDHGTVACLSTVVGFKISDLKRFDEFYANYAVHPWIFHTDENHTDLPVLDPRMAAENHKYRIFGLGMFFEALYSSGNNYYVNLMRMTLKNQAEFKYLVYSKERNPHATALMEHGIVGEAPKSQKRPRPQDRINNSLEGSLEKLSTPEYNAFSSIIGDVWETYVNQMGKRTAKTHIEEFANQTIDGMIARTRTQSGRKEALKRVYQALLELADGTE